MVFTMKVILNMGFSGFNFPNKTNPLVVGITYEKYGSNGLYLLNRSYTLHQGYLGIS